MNYKETAEFMKDLHEVLKKHGMSAISGQSDKLQEATKSLEGYHFFFTKGEKKLFLRIGENVEFENSITLSLSKTRYKPENHEDDGN